MKKLVLALAMMAGLTGMAAAQTTKAATQKAPAAKTTAAPVAKPAPAATAAKPAVKPAATAAKTDANGVVLKKDGTPDKRYKNAPAAAGPLKKDGTPDKRFKANKKG